MSNSQSPEYIGSVQWMFSGPTVKSGSAAKRGFTVVFSLLNADHQKIAADGKLEVLVRHRNNNLFSRQRFNFTVPASSFDNVEITNYGRHLGQIKRYGCVVRCNRAVLADDNFWAVELWFTTTDGRKLYGKSQQGVVVHTDSEWSVICSN